MATPVATPKSEFTELQRVGAKPEDRDSMQVATDDDDKPKTQQLTCGEQCYRILLIMTNLLWLLGGIAGAVTVPIAMSSFPFFSVCSQCRLYAPYVAGALASIALIGFIGLYAAFRRNFCCILMYNFLQVLLFVLFVSWTILVLATATGALDTIAKDNWMDAVTKKPEGICDVQSAFDCTGWDLPCGSSPPSNVTTASPKPPTPTTVPPNTTATPSTASPSIPPTTTTTSPLPANTSAPNATTSPPMTTTVAPSTTTTPPTTTTAPSPPNTTASPPNGTTATPTITTTTPPSSFPTPILTSIPTTTTAPVRRILQHHNVFGTAGNATTTSPANGTTTSPQPTGIPGCVVCPNQTPKSQTCGTQIKSRFKEYFIIVLASGVFGALVTLSCIVMAWRIRQKKQVKVTRVSLNAAVKK